MVEDFDDPRHIYQARAARAAADAERDFVRSVDREPAEPENTPVGMLLRALRDHSDSPSGDGPVLS